VSRVGPPARPIEPAPSGYVFDLRAAEPGEDLVAAGADLRPGTLLAAYRAGLFPMGLGRAGKGPMGWWSPDPRGILPLDGLRVSRSLRRSLGRFELRVDTDFGAVVAACADPSRPGRWITPAVADAYGELHRLGWAHSVECWSGGRLVGGLYGVAVGHVFYGESMFALERDASKVALRRLCDELNARDFHMIDCQMATPHLLGLGAQLIPRSDFIDLLQLHATLQVPPGSWTQSKLSIAQA
jgi:leucyl/phenylalanyl-tRNA---protein transferase